MQIYTPFRHRFHTIVTFSTPFRASDESDEPSVSRRFSSWDDEDW